MTKNSRLVYSTNQGRIQSVTAHNNLPTEGIADGVVRIQRETKGRGGKSVTVISGVPPSNLKPISKLLKSRCATGGAVKDNNIEIQGEHLPKIMDILHTQGYKVVKTGG